MQPDNNDALKDLQDRIADQKRQAGMIDTVQQDTQPTAEATNMQVGIKAGTEFVGSLLGGGLLGWLIDGWVNSAPIGMIVGIFVGVVVAFWNLYKLTLPPASTGLQ